MYVLVCYSIWSLQLLNFVHHRYDLSVLARIEVWVLLCVVHSAVVNLAHYVSVEAVFLLWKFTNASRWRSLTATCTRSMMRTHLWVTKASHHHNVVVSELAWRIHSLLDIDVLALELLNLPFDRVLHEVLLLSLVQLSWIHLSWLLRWVEAIASGRLFLAILVLSELAVVAQWWRRWDTDACWIAVVAKGTELDCFVIVLGLRRIWMVL